MLQAEDGMSFVKASMISRAPASVILIRLMVGAVFLSEGIQKFLFAAQVGSGRFAKIGIPYPEFTGPFVGGVEILFGSLVVLGWYTRLACIPLLIDMGVAIMATKLPILFGQGYWGFSVPTTAYGGFWGMLHEARTDWCMSIGAFYLLLVGAGPWSIDALTGKREVEW
jgi:putative oxidoreductase